MDHEASARNLLEHILLDESEDPTSFPIWLLESITDNFSDDHKIGSGGFADVYKGLLKNGIVAVKKLKLSEMVDVHETKFIQEVDSLMKVKHKNIVRFLGYCSDTQGKMLKHKGKNTMVEERQRFLCFEFLPEGSLDKHITDATSGLEWRIRYHIIKGICEGLHYLHEKKIVHSDLKPANILLDDKMVPKIGDFGLARSFDSKQTRAITGYVFGSLGYMAPEYMRGVITFKTDIYSLGVLIIEILTGQKMDPSIENVLENWKGRIKISDGDSELEQVRAFTEIGIKCIDPNPGMRPDTDCIIQMIDEMERGYGFIRTDGFTPSAKNVCYLGFSETRKLLDVHPLELRFPLEPKQRIECPVTLTNRTDHYVGVWITPTDLFFHGDYLVSWEDACPSIFQLMEPHSTRAVAMAVEVEKWGRRPRGKGKLDVLMIVLRSKEHLEKLRAPVIGRRLNIDKAFLHRANKLGAEVHLAALKAIICDPASCQKEVTLYRCPVAWSIGFDGQRRPLLGNISCIDAHPTDSRILVGHMGAYVSIWNFQTQERVMVLQVITNGNNCLLIRSVKFIPREHWVAIGDNDGWVHVYAEPTEEKIKEFEAHHGESVSLLTVHSTNPFLLTSSFTDTSIKLWDWDQDWMCTRTFNMPNTGLFRLMWNPIDESTFGQKIDESITFAGVSYDKSIKVWNIQSSEPIIMSEGTENARYLYSDSHDHLMVIGCDRSACIWDLRSQECVHRLGFSDLDIYDVACHPTLPLLATSHSFGQTVCFWDTRTYRLEKMVQLREPHMQGMVFTAARDLTRLMAKCWAGILIIEVNLQL